MKLYEFDFWIIIRLVFECHDHEAIIIQSYHFNVRFLHKTMGSEKKTFYGSRFNRLNYEKCLAIWHYDMRFFCTQYQSDRLVKM